MECSAALSLLSGHIDDQNTPQEEAALLAHLSECPDCRALLRAYEDIDRNVAALEVPAPAELAPAVMAQISKPLKQKRRSPWLGIGVSSGIVAAVLALLVGTKALSLPKLSDGMVNEGSLIMTQAPGAQAEDPAPGAEAVHETVASVGIGQEATDAPAMAEPEDTPGMQKGGNYSRHEGVPSNFVCAPIDEQAEETYALLAELNYAPILLYSGMDIDFFTVLAQAAPELSERLTVSAETETDEETGAVFIASDYTTVAALHEFLKQALLTEEAEAEFDADLLDDIRGQYALYGFDGSHLETVCPDGITVSGVSLPDNWPIDFTKQWITGQNWRLFFPEEDYAPAEEDLAFLVLIAPVPAQ